MKLIQTFESFSQPSLTELALSCTSLVDFVRTQPLLFPKSKIKQTLFHGTTFDFTGFNNDYDREEEECSYDFELPNGMIFLTTDEREAVCYNPFVVPCDVSVKKVMVYKVDNDAPSIAFDDDYNYGGKIWSIFEDGGYEAIEVRGIHKSTFITFPEFVTPKLELAHAWLKAHPKNYQHFKRND